MDVCSFVVVVFLKIGIIFQKFRSQKCLLYLVIRNCWWLCEAPPAQSKREGRHGGFVKVGAPPQLSLAMKGSRGWGRAGLFHELRGRGSMVNTAGKKTRGGGGGDDWWSKTLRMWAGESRAQRRGQARIRGHFSLEKRGRRKGQCRSGGSAGSMAGAWVHSDLGL